MHNKCMGLYGNLAHNSWYIICHAFLSDKSLLMKILRTFQAIIRCSQKCAASNISKTSASVSSGFPSTRKLMKAQGHRPSAFIVFECLETLMKHEARVFEIASQKCIMNQEQ